MLNNILRVYCIYIYICMYVYIRRLTLRSRPADWVQYNNKENKNKEDNDSSALHNYNNNNDIGNSHKHS